MSKRDKITVHLPKMLHAALLTEHPGNSQKQSRHEFSELRKSIRENGFDESLLVIPSGEGYEVVSGNHRFRAGKAEGMEEFPCVIRDDWNDIKAEVESVRRNYVRGKIDKTAFTAQVDRLASTSSLPLDVIYEQMGFEDADAFSDYYEKEKKAQAEIARQVSEASTSAQAVRMLDDLGTVLSTILAEHGHTVPNSFIVFPAGGKHHMYVASSPALKQAVTAVAETAVSQGLDINVALAGLLHIGMAHSSFLSGETDKVREEGKVTEGDSDLEPMK